MEADVCPGSPPVADSLYIGGVHCRVHTSPPLVLSPRDAVYDGFGQAPPGSTDLQALDVALSSGPVAPATDVAPVFDAGAWALYRSDNDRVFVLPPRGDPLWCAALEPGLSAARVSVGEAFLTPAAGGRQLCRNPVSYPLDQLLLMYRLASCQGLILHAAGVVVAGQGVVLAGASGAGKSTVARRLLEAGVGDALLSDDRVVIRLVDGKWSVFGTPWSGDAHVACNLTAPLRAVLFLQQGRGADVRPVAPAAALHMLLAVASVNWYDEAPMSMQLRTCETLVSHVPCASLEFGLDAGGDQVLECLARTVDVAAAPA